MDLEEAETQDIEEKLSQVIEKRVSQGIQKNWAGIEKSRYWPHYEHIGADPTGAVYWNDRGIKGHVKEV